MDEFRNPRDFGILGQTLPEPVFDGFDVMVGTGFDKLDRFPVGLGKIRRESIELRDGGGEKAGTSAMCGALLNALSHSISN